MPKGLTLPDDVALGEVELVVADVKQVARFYRDLLGCATDVRDEATVVYHPASPQRPLLVLREDSQAQPPSPRAPGLYHTAFRVANRRELARVLARMANLGIYLDGVADHLVSEALYLHDPEFNGVEVYADRPKEKWPRQGLYINMDTLPLDLDALLAELQAPGNGTTRVDVGHVHLKVSDLDQAEAFYSGLLGFEVKLRWRGALFVAAGDYHHHLGLNVWHSYQGGSVDPRSRGLRGFTLFLPLREWKSAVERLSSAAGVRLEGETAVLTDPFGIQVRLKPVRD